MSTSHLLPSPICDPGHRFIAAILHAQHTETRANCFALTITGGSTAGRSSFFSHSKTVCSCRLETLLCNSLLGMSDKARQEIPLGNLAKRLVSQLKPDRIDFLFFFFGSLRSQWCPGMFDKPRFFIVFVVLVPRAMPFWGDPNVTAFFPKTGESPPAPWSSDRWVVRSHSGRQTAFFCRGQAPLLPFSHTKLVLIYILGRDRETNGRF